MTTLKQQFALEKLVENGGNVTQAMREVGYSEATINSPSNLTGSKGFKAILEASGLNENFLVSALVEDIKKKPQNRIRELTLGADMLGLKKIGSTINIEQSKPIPIIQIPEALARRYGLTVINNDEKAGRILHKQMNNPTEK